MTPLNIIAKKVLFPNTVTWGRGASIYEPGGEGEGGERYTQSLTKELTDDAV